MECQVHRVQSEHQGWCVLHAAQGLDWPYALHVAQGAGNKHALHVVPCWTNSACWLQGHARARSQGWSGRVPHAVHTPDQPLCCVQPTFCIQHWGQDQHYVAYGVSPEYSMEHPAALGKPIAQGTLEAQCSRGTMAGEPRVRHSIQACGVAEVQGRHQDV